LEYFLDDALVAVPSEPEWPTLVLLDQTARLLDCLGGLKPSSSEIMVIFAAVYAALVADHLK